MTRVLIAFDKFKDALTAREANAIAAKTLQAKHPAWELDLCPLTDGGDGFCEILTEAAQGRCEDHHCTGPRGHSITAPIGYVDASTLRAELRRLLGCGDNSRIAIIEMASASGVALLSQRDRDPWQTSSRGTGELIAAAAKAGAETLLLGVGGSATNDLALGALASLGFRFLDVNGARVSDPVPASWSRIVRVEGTVSLPRLLIGCDVINPLLGPAGAATTFGAQKGLRAGDLPTLEEAATRMSAMLCDACDQPRALREVPGTGAAGGFAFGLMVAANARLISGSALVSDWLNLPARVADADIVLTGEGRYDATSLAGKGPGSLVAAARRLGKSVHVFAGSTDSGSGAHAITPPDMPLNQALREAAGLLSQKIAEIV